MKSMEKSEMNRRILLLLSSVLICGMSQYGRGQVVIIANANVKANEVTKADLRDIFTGAASSLKGSAVTPVLLKDGPANEEMLTLYVGKSDSAFRAYWRSLVFSGQGVMPRSLDSEAAVVEYVAHTPGAIGYVSKATTHEGVKTLGVR
jgi:ABC-type phosphate transport system substrate-binding protein